MRIIVLAITAAALAACVAPDSEIAILASNADGLKAFTSDRLCQVYQDSRKPLIRQELIQRGAVRPAYWQDIDAAAVRIGMTQTEMLCAMWPARLNTTMVSGITSVQWRQGDHYIYTDNGVITAIQN